jgi:hypothetical protein
VKLGPKLLNTISPRAETAEVKSAQASTVKVTTFFKAHPFRVHSRVKKTSFLLVNGLGYYHRF